MYTEKERQRAKDYYLKNKETIKARAKRDRIENPQKIKERKAKYYLENKKSIAQKTQRYRMNNKEKIRARRKRYYNTLRGGELIRASNYRAERKYKEKTSARCKLSYWIKKGKIIKPETCSACGENKRLDGHHPDYSKPLEVIWLCRICHNKIHNPAIEYVLG